MPGPLESASPAAAGGDGTPRAAPGTATRAIVAIAATLVALGLYFVFEPWLAERPFALFFAAVFVAAWHGGLSPGLLCTALSFVVLHLFILVPRGPVAFVDQGDVIQSLTFVGVSVMASALAGQLHRARVVAVASAEENALLALRLQEQAVELESQTEEAQSLTEELEEQVEEAARLRLQVEHANARLTSILDSLAEGVVLAAPDGAVTFANPAARRLLERLPGDRGPLRWDGRALDLSQPTPLAAALRSLDGPAQAELPVPARDGGAVLRVTAAPLRDGRAAVQGVVASFHDVTTEREAQTALRESEARFRTLADTAPVLIWMSDTDARRTFFNRAWLAFTGRTVAQERGEGWTGGVHPDDHGRCMDTYRASVQARRSYVMEYRLRRADGEYRWVLDNGVPRFDPRGGFTGFIGSCMDITERRENEEGLRFLAEAGAVLASSLDYEETLRRVCRLAVPVIADFCVVDLLEDGVIRRVEAAHADAAMADVVAAALRHPPALDHPAHPVPVVLRTGRTLLHNGIVMEMTDGTAEHRGLVDRLGTTAYLVVPLRAGTQVLGTLSLLITTSGRRYDGADVRRAEELGVRAGYAIENARLYARTAEANRAKSDFLAVMSHELRTPLNAILGYTDLFLAGIPEPLPGSMVPQVERVQSAARHLRGLIEEVLSFARLEGGHEEAQAEPADAAELAREVAALGEPLALERGLAFRLEVPEGPVPLRTDARKARQVLLNLVANAVKFTEAGEVRLAMEDAGTAVAFHVRDTGVGIAPENQERVFEPFWQADQRLAREHGGSGLGLAVARQLARLLGGDVTVRSAPGAGSTFTFRLPKNVVRAEHRAGSDRRDGADRRAPSPGN
ncbi:MAG TPA: ATP-binding protein [Longimicrobium sp.]